MLKSIFILFLITLIPGLELRASIPMGIFGGESIAVILPWPLTVLICIIANIVIGWAVFFLLDPLVTLCRRFPWFEKWIMRYLERAQRKLKPNVEKYGTFGLAVFIGIPLPLTGAYTGAAGAYALGMGKRKFLIANVIGVLIAATFVTAICLLIRAGVNLPIFNWLIKA